MRPSLSPPEIAELYRVALIQTDQDEPRARQLVEAYLRGYDVLRSARRVQP